MNPRATLNPLALPTETRARFSMVMIAALLLTWSFTLIVAKGSNLDAEMKLVSEASRWARENGNESVLEHSPEELREVLALTRQVGALHRPRLVAAISAVVAVALLAILLALTHPFRKARRLRTVPLERTSAPEIVDTLRERARREGLGSEIQVEHRPGIVGGALAYGLPGKERLSLSGDPTWLRATWPSLTEPQALHELAHLVHGDTHLIEWSKDLWLAFTVVLVSAFGIAAIALPRFPVEIALHCCLLLLVLFVLRRGLVRVRELYADARVVLWGKGKELAAVLKLAVQPTRWGAHPLGRERHRALIDPSLLFRIDGGLALSTGVLLSIVSGAGLVLLFEVILWLMMSAEEILVSSLSTLAHSVSSPTCTARVLFVIVLRIAPGALLTLVVLFVLTYLTTRSLGIQVLRSGVSNLDRGQPLRGHYAQLGITAVLMAIGFEAGLWINPLKIGVPRGPLAIVLIPAWVLMLAALLFLWLIYQQVAGQLLVSTRRTAISSRWRTRGFALGSSVLLVILMLPCYLGRLALICLEPARAGQLVLIAGSDPWESYLYLMGLTTFFLLAFALFFFAAWFMGTLAAVGFGALSSGRECSLCGHVEPRWLAVGRDCTNCHLPLAPWLYHGETGSE